MNEETLIILFIDILAFIAAVPVFIKCAMFLHERFKKQERESEKLVRESNEFLHGLRD